ncbi:MAG: nucleoside kinase, partial [bacterium]
IYEQAVIKGVAEKLLKHIKHKDESYYEARRLLYYLDFFLSISDEHVPQNSILREFIGESSFHY